MFSFPAMNSLNSLFIIKFLWRHKFSSWRCSSLITVWSCCQDQVISLSSWDRWDLSDNMARVSISPLSVKAPRVWLIRGRGRPHGWTQNWKPKQAFMLINFYFICRIPTSALLHFKSVLLLTFVVFNLHN